MTTATSLKTTTTPAPPTATMPEPPGLRRRAARLGAAATILFMAEIPLYFVYAGAPPDGNILTRILINLAAVAFLIPFLAAVGQLIHRRDAEIDWVTATIVIAGAVWLTL